jgi:hypothetical protein
MTGHPVRLLVLGALVALALAGCAETKRSLGLGKQPPDEFQVVRRAPLSVPPDFGLRPPDPGAPRPQEEVPRDQAEAILFGASGGAASGSSGLTELLSKAGVAAADPAIRQIINEDNALLAEDVSLTDRLIFWREPASQGVIVDAEAEAQRLSENAAVGEPPTAGATPVIEEREKAIFEGIF